MAVANCTSAPVRADHPTASPRIVPALVGGARTQIECPSWCTLDHVAENEPRLTDVYHSGEIADLMAPPMDGTPELLAYARLSVEPYSGDAALRRLFVAVGDGDGGSANLNPSQADEFADDLMLFAMRIRAMARAARGVA